MVRWRGVTVLVTILFVGPRGFTGGLWLPSDRNRRHVALRATVPQEDAVKTVLQQVSRMNNDELERLVEDTGKDEGNTWDWKGMNLKLIKSLYKHTKFAKVTQFTHALGLSLAVRM